MVTLGFINKDNAPTIKTAQCLLSDLECHPTAILDKTVVIFHDESIFSAKHSGVVLTCIRLNQRVKVLVLWLQSL